MNFNIGGVKLHISKNPNNRLRFWNAIGMFSNLSKVERNGVWYKCGVDFKQEENRYTITLRDLYLTDENDRVTHHEKGIYKEFQISSFKKTLIEMLLNRHSINRKWFEFRSTSYKRRNTIYVFSISIFLALFYYFGNEYFNNGWANYIANNSAIQALFILLNIFSIGSIFFPFTIQKQIEQEDIRKIFAEETQKNFDIEKARRSAQVRSSL